MRLGIHKAEAKASSVLQSLDISEIPIPVETIAHHFGLSISYELDDEISGLLILKNGTAVIGVNKKESKVRQRFTIAHEIGHFVLHKNKAELFVDQNYIVMKRSGEKDFLEREANAFAAALLMPENAIEDCLKNNINKVSTETKITELSDQFNVSQIAMTYRLSNLGLL